MDIYSKINTASITAPNVCRGIIQSNILGPDDTAFIFYSRILLARRLEVLRESFRNLDVLHTVAIKTNPHPAILQFIADQGIGLEAASFEEVHLAAGAGVKFDNIIYNSPVKTTRELSYCATHFPGIRINANSTEELSRIPTGHKVKLGLRINPLVASSSDALFNVSMEDSKFGVPITREEEIFNAICNHDIQTIHIHIGSRIEAPKILLDALRKTVIFCDKINRKLENSRNRVYIKEINFGGGLSALDHIEHSDELMRSYAAGVAEITANTDFKYNLIDEFGQWIHRHNGFAYSRVEYVQEINGKYIAYLHLGADFFPREIYTKTNKLEFEFLDCQGNTKKTPVVSTDLAGPLCFNGDYLAKELHAPALEPGDIVAIKSVGANTYGLWLRHCSRTYPVFLSEQMDNHGKFEVLSKRFNPYVSFFSK